MRISTYLLIVFYILTACDSDDDLNNNNPNFLVIFTDDQRASAIGYANDEVHTPNLDKLASTGKIFDNAFVTLSICSPSRAALLTGRYGSSNGVTTFGNVSLNPGETTFANQLKNLGYQTGIIGKWHLKSTPEACGFDHATYFFSNGPWYDRTVVENGKEKTAPGFIEKYIADKSIAFIDSVSKNEAPFLLFHCTQVPHLDNHFEWDIQPSTMEKHYQNSNIQPPENWKDDLSNKPGYLDSGRHRIRAIQYGYRSKDTLLNETKRYFASITEMDTQLGRIFNSLEENGVDKNTYIIFMGDNGWFIGDHLFTSKVLPYEESISVPLFINGPGIEPGRNQEIVLNIDIFPTILDILDRDIPADIHGESMKPLLQGEQVSWRDRFLYEAPEPQLGSWPLWAIRTDKWKYIETYHIENTDSLIFTELYNLEEDPSELNNLADELENKDQLVRFSQQLNNLKNQYTGKK